MTYDLEVHYKNHICATYDEAHEALSLNKTIWAKLIEEEYGGTNSSLNIINLCLQCWTIKQRFIPKAVKSGWTEPPNENARNQMIEELKMYIQSQRGIL